MAISVVPCAPQTRALAGVRSRITRLWFKVRSVGQYAGHWQRLAELLDACGNEIELCMSPPAGKRHLAEKGREL